MGYELSGDMADNSLEVVQGRNSAVNLSSIMFNYNSRFNRFNGNNIIKDHKMQMLLTPFYFLIIILQNNVLFFFN